MAVLSDADREDTTRQLIVKLFVESNATAQLTTDEVRTMVNDLDSYLDANAVVINNVITASVRAKATTTQKALAVAWIALKRAGAI